MIFVDDFYSKEHSNFIYGQMKAKHVTEYLCTYYHVTLTMKTYKINPARHKD